MKYATRTHALTHIPYHCQSCELIKGYIGMGVVRPETNFLIDSSFGEQKKPTKKHHLLEYTDFFVPVNSLALSLPFW